MPRRFTSLRLTVPVHRDKGRRDVELHHCCYGLILTRTEWQGSAVSSWFLLSSFGRKLVTWCEFKGGLNWSVLGLLQAPIFSPATGGHRRGSISFGQKATPPHLLFWIVSFGLDQLLIWACCAMWCVLRQGMGWDGLTRERSQVILVEGSSHVALLKIILHWRGCTEDWRPVWTQVVGCPLTSLLVWCNLGEILLLLTPLLLSVTAPCKQDLPGDDCMCTDSLSLEVSWKPVSQAVIFRFLWTKSPTVHHKFSRWSQRGSLVTLLPSMYLHHRNRCVFHRGQAGPLGLWKSRPLARHSSLPLHHLTTEAWLCHLCKLQSKNLLTKTILVFYKENGSAFFIESTQRTSVCQLL